MSSEPNSSNRSVGIGALLRAPIPLPFSIRGRWRNHGWRSIIAGAGLPADISGLVNEVVRRTRLWAGERADVAGELVAHFQDGLAAGVSPDELIQKFGDPRQAASLMRSAKRRMRPLWWQAGRWVGYATLSLVGLLALLTLWFFLRSPTLARNFTAELNAPLLATPESDRAWPLYKQALAALPPDPMVVERATFDPSKNEVRWDWTASRPSDPRWSDAVAYIRAAAPALELARRAGQKPALGFVMSNQVDEELLRINARRAGQPFTAVPEEPDPNPDLYGVLLPHLGEFRQLARHFNIDSRLAAEEGDPARIISNVRAMRGLSRHTMETPFLISRLVSSAIEWLTQTMLIDILERHPALFSRAQLVELSHTLAEADSESRDPMRSIEIERMGFMDLLQRCYSDDGHGNGRLTPEGVRFLTRQASINGSKPPTAMDWIEGIGSNFVLADRRAQLDRYDAILREVAEGWSTPIWAFEGDSQQCKDLMDTPSRLERARFLPVSIMVPALTKFHTTVSMEAHIRQAALAVLAMHAFKADTGAWPASLDALVPRYLPSLPIDMFDGKPLRYRLTNAGPLMYSIGSNRVDDGGLPYNENVPAWSWRSPSTTKNPGKDPWNTIAQGDWIIFPPSKASIPKPAPATPAQ